MFRLVFCCLVFHLCCGCRSNLDVLEQDFEELEIRSVETGFKFVFSDVEIALLNDQWPRTREVFPSSFVDFEYSLSSTDGTKLAGSGRLWGSGSNCFLSLWAEDGSSDVATFESGKLVNVLSYERSGSLAAGLAR